MPESGHKPRVLALAGSLRQGSYNKRLIRNGAEALERAGAEVDLVELNEFTIPIYDGDLEDSEGLPEAVVAFKRRLSLADGFMFASPEYNHSIPGPFKNALDWASRGDEDVFDGKVAALMAASPGQYGGMRMLPHLRQVLTALGLWLVPEHVAVAKASEAFKDDGSLASPFYSKQVQTLADLLVGELELRRPKAPKKEPQTDLQVVLYPEWEQSRPMPGG